MLCMWSRRRALWGNTHNTLQCQHHFSLFNFLSFASLATWLQVYFVYNSQDCGFGDGGEGVCILCEEGKFSADTSIAPCIRCTQCKLLNRLEKTACSPISDAQCGQCLPRWVTPTKPGYNYLISASILEVFFVCFFVECMNVIVCTGIMNSGAWLGKWSWPVCLVTTMTQHIKSVCFWQLKAPKEVRFKDVNKLL